MGHRDLCREQCAEYRSKIRVAHGTQRSMERAMCGVQVKDRKRDGTQRSMLYLLERWGTDIYAMCGVQVKDRKWDTEIYSIFEYSAHCSKR